MAESFVHLFAGISRQREIRLGEKSSDLHELACDAIVSRESTAQDVPCQGCGRTFGAKTWLIRCGRCAMLDWPRLTVFARCPFCGGDSALLREYESHIAREHPVPSAILGVTYA